MTVTRLVDVAPPHHDRFRYRVPQFEVRIAGAAVPHDVLRDVLKLTYHDSTTELDGFELEVSNWDSVERRFKYVGAETSEELQGSTDASERFRLFEPCNRTVELRLGYLDALSLVLTGSVTTMEPRFPTSGGPTLTVRGLNVLHQLRRKPYTWSWENQRDSEIAANVATLRDPDTGRRRFPLPIDVDATAQRQEEPIEYVTQQNQYDIDFLFTRARQRGYVVRVREGREPRDRRLYFGPPPRGQGSTPMVTYELRWGQSLLEFTPTLTTANQVKSVTVNGWNRRTHEAISCQVGIDDPQVNRNRDLRALLESCDPREDVVVNEPVFTEREARRRAVAILEARQRDMVRASGSTIGLPDLRAGQLVHITNLGARFSGRYFVTSTTHTIDEAGYVTRFEASRLDDGQGGGAAA